MQTCFLLVRHATCTRANDVLLGRCVDAALDADGLRQARALATRIRGESPMQVISSPRRRALQTACVIAAAADCRVDLAAELDEMDYGCWAGRTFAELEGDAGWQRWNRDRAHATTPAGMGIREVQQRVFRYLGALSRSTGIGATLVLVTHAEIIRSVILRCIGASESEFGRVPVAPASIARLIVGARGVRLLAASQGARKAIPAA